MKLKNLILLSISLSHLNSLISSQNSSQSACDVIAEVLKNEPWMKTVAIVKFKNNFQGDAIDNLLQCLPMEISTLIMDMKEFDWKRPRIHNPSLVVMVVDDVKDLVDKKKLYKLLLDSQNIPFLNHNSRFLILTTKRSSQFREEVANVLDGCSITNFEIILDAADEVPMEPNQTNQIEQKLPRKSSNVTHNILAFSQTPIVMVKGNQVYSKYTHYLKIVTEVEKSKLNFTLSSNITTMKKISEKFNQLVSEGKIDMSLNTWTLKDDATPRLLTYEESGYCAIVPMPGKHLKTGTIFRPFDLGVWLMILILIIVTMILWYFAGHAKSAFNIPFLILAFYLGQSVKLPTRKVFKILLQLWILIAFYLGYCYQGSITSFMIQNYEKPRLHSIDELFESDYKIMVRDRLNRLMNDSLRYQKADLDERINKSGSYISFLNYPKVFEDKFVMIIECDQATGLVDTGRLKRVYVIEDILMASFIRLRMKRMSKSLKQWQLIMDHCFEAGLPKAWEIFEEVRNKIIVKEDRDDGILRLPDFFSLFCGLFTGLALAGLVLIIEIVYHKYLEPLIEHWMLLREVRRLKRKAFFVPTNVRRIQVRQAD